VGKGGRVGTLLLFSWGDPPLALGGGEGIKRGGGVTDTYLPGAGRGREGIKKVFSAKEKRKEKENGINNHYLVIMLRVSKKKEEKKTQYFLPVKREKRTTPVLLRREGREGERPSFCKPKGKKKGGEA